MKEGLVKEDLNFITLVWTDIYMNPWVLLGFPAHGFILQASRPKDFIGCISLTRLPY
jgi:hypothetical protein